MPTFAEIERIQNFLRASAHAHYEALVLAPFTMFFHASDPLKYFNYAIPDHPVTGDLGVVLAEMRHEYRRRGRTARFEFFEAFALHLPALLLANGFLEEGRQWGMLCTPHTLQAVPEVTGLEICTLGPESTWQDVHDLMLTQQIGFSPNEPAEVAPEDVQREFIEVQQGRRHAVLGRIDGQPAGAAAFSTIIDGVSEAAGIATHPDFRRRGIAARLTWLAVQSAFNLGAQTVCLTAEDARAGRVYERVGFQPFSTMLAYIDSSE